MEKEIINTGNAPAAAGPYSQAVRVGDLVYTAGQVAMDPASGQVVEGDVQVQTRQVLRNLQAVLQAAGSDLAHVVKTTVFLQNMDHFAAMNEAYAGFFGEAPPARSAVEVARLPLGVLVEIEAVAIVGAAT